MGTYRRFAVRGRTGSDNVTIREYETPSRIHDKATGIGAAGRLSVSTPILRHPGTKQHKERQQPTLLVRLL